MVLCSLAATLPSSFAHAQQSAAADKPAQEVRIFHLLNYSDQQDSSTVYYDVKNVLSPGAQVQLDQTHAALVVRGSAQDFATTEKIIAEFDKPKKLYRLTFTIATFDSGKKVGDQHYAVVIAMGGRTTLKNGSKVPVATGSYGKDNQTQETQFTYLDVGINMDLQIDPAEGGARLHSKFEQSSATETHTIAGVQEPVVRQTVLDSSSFLRIGKPVTLGSIDVTDSPRHLDISVVMEPVQ
jgi:type II secretory pathway component GspD/PulD (secretin)